MATDEHSTPDRAPAPAPASASASGRLNAADDLGGESACMLDRVCPECGRLADTMPPTTCARCGARVGDPD